MTRLSAFDEARRDDLVYLRKGAGLTGARLAKRPGLLHLVRQPTDPERGAAVLREIVFHLSQEDATGEALASAYGFIRETQASTLGQRRKIYAELRGISEDTARNWEDAAIERLLLLLLNEAARAPDLYQFVTHGFLIRRMLVDTTIYDDHATSMQTREIVAVARPLDVYQVGHSHHGQIESADGIEITEATRTRAGVIYDCHLPRVLPPGESHTFTILGREAHDYAGTDEPFVAYVFHEPTVLFDLKVRFRLTQPPRRAWWFHQLHPLELPGDPSISLWATFNGGVTQRTFEMLQGGFATGLGWL